MKNTNNDIYFDEVNLPFVPDREYAPYSRNELALCGYEQASTYLKEKLEKSADHYWVCIYNFTK